MTHKRSTREIAMEGVLRRALPYLDFYAVDVGNSRSCFECGVHGNAPHDDDCPGVQLLADIRTVLDDREEEA